MKNLKNVNSFKIIFIFIIGEILFLTLPFVVWSSIDKGQQIRKVGEAIAKIDGKKDKLNYIYNFFLQQHNCNGLYVKTFLVLEQLNLFCSSLCFVFISLNWEIMPKDVYHFFLQKCGKIFEIFPMMTGCTYELNGIIPGSTDFLETACFININEVYRVIVTGLYVWLLILMALGIGNIFKRILQLCFRPVRSLSLNNSTFNVNTTLLVRVLSFSDYFIIENLSRHIENELFSNFCNAILEELCPTVPVIQSRD